MKISLAHLPIAFVLFLGVVLFAEAQTTTPETGVASMSTTTETLAPPTENETEHTTGQTDHTPFRPLVSEESHTALSAVLQKRIINLAANISNRVDAAVGRLTNIADRLARRMQKLEASGIDTTAAKVPLAEAQAALSNITARMETIDVIVYNSVTSETPRETWQNIKAIFAGVSGDLHSAQEALRITVAALKQAALDAELNRSASEAVTQDETTEITVE